jgi:hypothetical protein
MLQDALFRRLWRIVTHVAHPHDICAGYLVVSVAPFEHLGHACHNPYRNLTAKVELFQALQ